jgi:hypothetical protein
MGNNSGTPKRSKRFKWSIRIAVALFLYTVIGFFVVPAIIKSQMLKRIPPLTLRQVSIDQVRCNPYALSLTIRGFSLKEPDGTVFLSFDEFYANFQLSSIFRRKFTFAEISLVKPYAHVIWKPDGSFNFANILTNLPPPAPGPPKPPPPALIFQFSVTNGCVAFDDLTRRTPFHTAFVPINVGLTNLTTVRDKNSPYSFIARTGEGEVFAWGGHVSLNPIGSDGTFRLGGLALAKYGPYAEDYARFKIAGGTVDVAADYSYESTNNPLDLQVSNAVVHLENFELKDSGTGETVLSIPSLSVENAAGAVVQRSATVGAIRSSDGFILARQNHDGTINLLSQLILPTNTAPAAAAAKSSSPLAGPWTAKIDEIAFTNYSVRAEDRKPPAPAAFDIDQIAFDIKNVSNASNTPVNVSLTARFQKTGSVAVDGTATLLPPSADLQLAVSNIDLRAVQPYVEQQVKLIVAGGAVNVHGRAQYASPAPGAPLASFAGDFALNNFVTTDDVLYKNFITWDSLDVNGIHLALLPNSLAVHDIKLTGLSASAIRGPNELLNLQTILRKDTNAAPAPPPPPTTTAGAPKGFQMPALPPISVGSVDLVKASIHGADQSLEPHFSFDVAEFGGTITGLSSQPGTTATIDVSGEVDARSPFHVTGRLNPLSTNLFADIAVAFTNTELTPFTPYTEKYAGRPLEKGKLSFAVHYLVQTNSVKGENGFFIDQMTLGAWNNSPSATHLPVKLAIALLKDRNGRIALDVPITGTIGDPKFRIMPIIWHVVANLIAKAATSPFSLLGAAFGGGEEMSFVDFPPGHSEIVETQTNKLNTLAKALFERPAVSLEISGGVDPLGDHDALARLRLDDQLKAMWIREQGGGTNVSLATVNLTTNQYDRLLERAYRQKFGSYVPGALITNSAAAGTNQAVVAGSASAQKPGRHNGRATEASTMRGATLLMESLQPRKPVAVPASIAADLPGLAATGGASTIVLSPEQARILDMKEQLLQSIQVTEDDLRDLMQARANRVQKYLLDTGKVTADRLFIIAPKPVNPAARGQSRANLSLD